MMSPCDVNLSIILNQPFGMTMILVRHLVEILPSLFLKQILQAQLLFVLLFFLDFISNIIVQLRTQMVFLL